MSYMELLKEYSSALKALDAAMDISKDVSAEEFQALKHRIHDGENKINMEIEKLNNPKDDKLNSYITAGYSIIAHQFGMKGVLYGRLEGKGELVNIPSEYFSKDGYNYSMKTNEIKFKNGIYYTDVKADNDAFDDYVKHKTKIEG